MLIRNIRRLLVFVIGMTVLTVGVIFIVTPGPALVLIPAGLAILGTEFPWAQRLLKKMRDRATAVAKAAVGTNKDERRS